MPSQPSVRMKPTRGRIVKMNWVFRLAAELVLLLCIHQTVCGFGTEEQGPRFTVEPPVSVFFSNATGARIECAAEGTPQPLVRWQTVADGKTVADVPDVVRVEGNGTLIFLPFAEDLYSPDIHSAAYRCVAHSRAGTIVSRSVFVRAEVVRDFEPVVRDTVTMPGNVAVFSCIIPGVDYNGSDGPPDSVAITSWVQDGVFNIFPSWEIDSKIIMVPKSGNLRIGNVDENDLRHSYTCRIVNKLTGFTQESGANGRIYFESNRTLAPWSKSPVFTLHLVKQGEHLLLPCDVYGFPPPQVSWTSGTSADQEFSEPPAGVEKKKYPMNFFRLRSVQKSDAGNYTCTASNVAGHLRLHHRVIVIPDMSAQVVPSHYEIEAGRSTSFTCITSSNDENQIVTWLKNGEPRKSTSSTPPTYTLNIDSVQKHDQGIYQCVVTNKLNNEMAQSFAELRLSGPSVKIYPSIVYVCLPGDEAVKTVNLLNSSAMPAQFHAQLDDVNSPIKCHPSFGTFKNGFQLRLEFKPYRTGYYYTRLYFLIPYHANFDVYASSEFGCVTVGDKNKVVGPTIQVGCEIDMKVPVINNTRHRVRYLIKPGTKNMSVNVKQRLWTAATSRSGGEGDTFEGEEQDFEDFEGIEANDYTSSKGESYSGLDIAGKKTTDSNSDHSSMVSVDSLPTLSGSAINALTTKVRSSYNSGFSSVFRMERLTGELAPNERGCLMLWLCPPDIGQYTLKAKCYVLCNEFPDVVTTARLIFTVNGCQARVRIGPSENFHLNDMIINTRQTIKFSVIQESLTLINMKFGVNHPERFKLYWPMPTYKIRPHRFRFTAENKQCDIELTICPVELGHQDLVVCVETDSKRTPRIISNINISLKSIACTLSVSAISNDWEPYFGRMTLNKLFNFEKLNDGLSRMHGKNIPTLVIPLPALSTPTLYNVQFYNPSKIRLNWSLKFRECLKCDNRGTQQKGEDCAHRKTVHVWPTSGKVEAFWVYNKDPVNGLPYSIIDDSLSPAHPYFRCLNPCTVVPPKSIHPILYVFAPDRLCKFQATVMLMAEGKKRFITLSGQGESYMRSTPIPRGLATKPVFKYKFIGHLVEPSAEVTLKCIAYGTPPPQISWKVDGFDVAQSQTRVAVSQYVTEVGEVISHFNITKVQVEDGGMYECVATNRAGMVSHSAKLQVHGNPVAKKSPKIIARAGQQLQINCPVSGYPILYVNWEKDNKKLPGLKLTNKRYKVFNNGSIIIDNVQKKTDQGTYYCEASNDNHVAKASVEVVVIEPPHIHPFTIEDGYHEGGRVGCQCFITKGDGPLSIQWLKNNQTLDSAASVPPLSVTYQNEYSSSLLIESIRLSHEGNYTCRATNPVATVEHTVTLTVLAPPEITPFYFSKLTEGSRVQVACTVHQGDLPMNLTWLKDGRMHHGSSGADITPFNEYSTILTVNNVSRSDTGDYTCVAANPVHSASYTAHLNVNVPPEWISEPKDMNVIRDDEAEINCSASGHPKPNIKWRKGTSKDSDQFTEVTDNVTSEGTLIINRVTKKHEGFYMCEANNDVGQPISAVIRLSVQDLPHIILPNTKYTSVNGGEVTMSCEATGDQPIHISWIKGSTQLNYKSNIPRYTVEEMYTDMSVRSKLTIKKVSATDSGRYVCVAENSLGKHEAAMELEIKVLGSPPDDLTCNETTPTSIRLRWTDLNANSPMSDHIQGYVVTYSRVVPPDDLINEYDEIEVFQSGDDVIISDLDTDTAYEFTIRVNTIQGPGKSSKPLICKTSESLPGPPAALKAMRMSPTTALITWIPPKNPNGKIKRYTLYEREILNGMQGVLKSQLYDHTIRQVQLSMFRDTVSYLWWVSATNDEGEGVKSHTATLSAAKSSGIPASIGTFSDTVQTKWHTDVDLPCIVSGIPTPNVKWTRDGQPIELHSQSKVYENFTLHLASVTSSDTGNYTCTAWNVYGSDVVSTDLLVVEPPKPPILGVMSTSWTNITVKWTKAPDTYAIQQYLLSYKYVNELDNMYTEVALSSRTNMFTLPNIKCGTTVAFSISASNRVGHGMQSRPFHVKTLQGQTPLAPSQEEAIEEMVSGILIHLQKWDGKHCPITHFNIFKRQPFEKDWTAVGENVAPTEIYSIDNLKPSTHYNILVKSFNSAGMTSTVYAVSTISPYGEKTNKRALSVNDKIMNVIYNIAGMWHYGIIVLCFITIGLTALMCIKYRHLYNKNNSERHLESNTMALKNTNCSRPQSPLEAYEPCASTHFKPKNTMVNNVESNYNEISPYATFQIAQEKSHPINKNYFCTSCANNADHCTCSRIYTPQLDYANYTMRSLSKRGNTFSDGAEDYKSHNGSLHEFYDMERVSNTCEQVKKPKRRLLPLPDARRITSQGSRDFRNPNLHETTFTMPIQHEMYRRDQNVVSDEENLEPMCSSNNIRPYIQRGCY